MSTRRRIILAKGKVPRTADLPTILYRNTPALKEVFALLFNLILKGGSIPGGVGESCPGPAFDFGQRPTPA